METLKKEHILNQKDNLSEEELIILKNHADEKQGFNFLLSLTFIVFPITYILYIICTVALIKLGRTRNTLLMVNTIQCLVMIILVLLCKAKYLKQTDTIEDLTSIIVADVISLKRDTKELIISYNDTNYLLSIKTLPSKYNKTLPYSKVLIYTTETNKIRFIPLKSKGEFK